MTKELNCRDAGFNSDAVVRAETDDEVMAQAATHANEVHGLQQIDSETEQRIRSVIHEA
jgi:predicted small metal-binding protein